MAADAVASSGIVATQRGRIGHLLLDRPRALNALDGAMIAAIVQALDHWRHMPDIHAVVVEGAGDRAFCAGGDIRMIRNLAVTGDDAGIHDFFASEYALNAAIADFPKPYISLIDGICMGGGIGLSVHGSVRVTTEQGLFAMPETAIAMFPDVGATHVLPRLPGALGMYLGLSGARLAGADAVHAGIATHFVPRDRLPALRRDLPIDGVAAVARHAAAVPPFSLDAARDAIDRCFSADDIPGILATLAAEGTAWSTEALAQLRAASPSAVHWSFAAIRRGAAAPSLTDALAAELRLTGRVTRHPDFAEGVRAMLVDKDRHPHWSPARLEDVDPAAVAAMFA